MNALMLRPLPIASATSSALTIGAAGYIANDYAGIVAGGTAGQALVLTVDMGADVAVDTIMMFGIEGAIDGTQQWQIATAAQGAFTGAYWTGAAEPLFAGTNKLVNGRGVSLWQAPAALPPPASARYFRVTIAPSTGVVVKVARMVVGKRLTLERNFAFGGNQGVRDFGSLDFSDRANLLRRRGPKLRTIGLSFPNAYKDEVEAAIAPLVEYLGNTDCVALCTDPAEHAMRQRRCYFGPLLGDLSMTWRNATGWEWRANLVSLF